MVYHVCDVVELLVGSNVVTVHSLYLFVQLFIRQRHVPVLLLLLHQLVGLQFDKVQLFMYVLEFFSFLKPHMTAITGSAIYGHASLLSELQLRTLATE